MWMLDSTYFVFQLSTQTLWLNYLCLFQPYLKHEPSLMQLYISGLQSQKNLQVSLTFCSHSVVTELTRRDKKQRCILVFFSQSYPELQRKAMQC